MKKSIIWLRRDLRWKDNYALSKATLDSDKVYPVFIYDENILNELENKSDHRLVFIQEALNNFERHTRIKITRLYGNPEKIIPEIAASLKVNAIYCNRDYEVYAKKRDEIVAKNLQEIGIFFYSLKDTVVFEFDELKNGKGDYYKVFTPFKNLWFEKLYQNPEVVAAYKIDLKKLTESKIKSVRSLKEIGFDSKISNEMHYDPDAEKLFKQFDKKINEYHAIRDLPAIAGTSKLSVHLRFGTISVRALVRKYLEEQIPGPKTWLSELAWRDFYFGILDKYPYVEQSCYIKKFDRIKWENDPQKFKAWCEGRTGVPIVDAAMRQLNQTGWMHNRCRMIVASYLVKTLLIDWRWGERYFAEKLIDFDLAANNGGWQWAASTGCDAAPYFRIFNPYRQSERFDPTGEYITKYCPELKGFPAKIVHDPTKAPGNYPDPIANYTKNRIRALELYKSCGD